MQIDHNIVLSKISSIEDTSLIDYMTEQGILAEVCLKYLQQVKLYDRQTKKHFFALGMLNDDDSFELQNQEYSGWINVDDDGQRDVSFIPGRKYPSHYLHVFLHMNDFLAMVAREKDHHFEGDVLILHSLDLLHNVHLYLDLYRYKHLFSWMPNTNEGKAAIDTMSSYCPLVPGVKKQVPMNKLFKKYETIREWCAAQSALIKG